MSFRSVYGQTRSENGWPMVNRDECVLVPLPFCDTAPIRSGAAAAVFEAFMREYAARVPGGVVSSVWGWSLVNDVATSNHLSATGWDVNAPQYPWGGSRMAQVFPNRVKAIRAILADFEGNVWWGADWDRKDEMHFQLNGGTCAGQGASEKLLEFVRRRIRDGRLITAAPEFLGSLSENQQHTVWSGFAQLDGPSG